MDRRCGRHRCAQIAQLCKWDGLARHQHLPQLPLDNNISERALRTPVIGRKNFYGSGAAWAAHLAADIWTVTATAARHDIEPLSLLTGYLQHAPTPAAPPRTESAWTRSCPGHPKDAPAVVPPAIPAGAKVPARNPGSPQSRPMPLCRMTPRAASSCPDGTTTRSPTGSPITTLDEYVTGAVLDARESPSVQEALREGV